MKQNHYRAIRWFAYAAVLVLIVLCLYAASLYSYLLFHSTVEEFSILIAFGVFLVGWYSVRYTDDRIFLFLGIAFFFIGMTDWLHTLAFWGMGVFPVGGTNLSAQLWIAARYLESITLVLAPLVKRRNLSRTYLAVAYSIAFGLLLATIFVWKVFPTCFIEGTGLTPFKVLSEYVISALLAISGFLFYTRRQDFDPDVIRLLIAALCVTIASELALTLYTDAYGLLTRSGHYLKIVAFYLIYRALVRASLIRPYDTLFRDLQHSKENEAERASRLEQVNTELESFSYSVSHDLGAPLRAMDGFSRELLEEYRGSLDEKGIHYLERVRAAAQRMGVMIDDLLKLSRVTRSQMSRVWVDVTSMARETAEELRRSDENRQVEFVITDHMVANADKGLLHAVLDNLIGNAWKFSAKRPLARIEVGTLREGTNTVYFVRDNGVGFDMQYADKLFTPFQRLHAREEFEGTGIGLATVRRIISRHGGRVWAESAPEQGATFYFTVTPEEGMNA